jgi:cobalamin biosynthesis protein CobT
MFEYDEDILEGRDMAQEISTLISEDAVEAIHQSDWSVFSREWDRVEPLEPPEEMPANWVPDLEEAVRQMTGRMQKDIERIMASQSHVVNTPGHKRGRLHSASLYRVAQGDPRVFTQRQEHKSKDTAVTLLVDNSGSMHSNNRIAAAMEAAYALSTTLDRVQINHEMIGFTTGDFFSRTKGEREMEKAIQEDYYKSGITYDRVIPLVLPIYKSFQERLDATVKKRIAYCMNARRGLNGNIDGESLLIAAERLARQTEKRKVMLVLSDGQPAGGPKSGPHLKSTVNYLNENGIETIGIGIQSNAVAKYYKNHVVLHNVEDLPGQVMTEIKRLLA